MIFVPSSGKRTARPAVLTSTSVFTLVPSIDALQQIVTVESVQVSCGNSATAFTLTWSDGTNTVKLINAKQIPANETYLMTDHHPPLKQGGSLTCQASVGNQLEVMCVTVDTSSNSQ